VTSNSTEPTARNNSNHTISRSAHQSACACEAFSRALSASSRRDWGRERGSVRRLAAAWAGAPPPAAAPERQFGRCRWRRAWTSSRSRPPARTGVSRCAARTAAAPTRLRHHCTARRLVELVEELRHRGRRLRWTFRAGARHAAHLRTRGSKACASWGSIGTQTRPVFGCTQKGALSRWFMCLETSMSRRGKV